MKALVADFAVLHASLIRDEVISSEGGIGCGGDLTFATNLILQGHYDLMRMEDKIEFLKRIHKETMKEIVGKKGKE